MSLLLEKYQNKLILINSFLEISKREFVILKNAYQPSMMPWVGYQIHMEYETLKNNLQKAEKYIPKT